jgi:hypothetical protein
MYALVIWVAALAVATTTPFTLGRQILLGRHPLTDLMQITPHLNK